MKMINMSGDSTLKDLSLRVAYSSEDANILNEFYIPTLSLAREYYRITGFFSSDSFAVAAEGISNLIKNDGKVKLITGFFIRPEDVNAAEQAMKYPELIMKEVDKLLVEYATLRLRSFNVLSSSMLIAFM